MGWIDTLWYVGEAGLSDRDPSTEETVINVPRRDNPRIVGSPPVDDETELADDVKRRQVALAVAYAATARSR